MELSSMRGSCTFKSVFKQLSLANFWWTPSSFVSDNSSSLFSLLCMPMKSLKMELALKNRKLNEIEVVKMQDYNMIYASKSAFWQNSIKTTNSIKNLFRTERRERKGSAAEEKSHWNGIYFSNCVLIDSSCQSVQQIILMVRKLPVNNVVVSFSEWSCPHSP